MSDRVHFCVHEKASIDALGFVRFGLIGFALAGRSIRVSVVLFVYSGFLGGDLVCWLCRVLAAPFCHCFLVLLNALFIAILLRSFRVIPTIRYRIVVDTTDFD
jgi:hypothetical protein